MRGVFGGPLGEQDGGAERLDPGIAAALSAAALGPAPEWPAGAARVVCFDWSDDGRVTSDGELSGLVTLDAPGTSMAAALDALATLCAALHAVHAVGLAHGDIGLDTVRTAQGGGVVLLRSARRLPAGALLSARVRSGASPSGIAFAAPEIATGFEATPASDVYAVGALTHRIATGQPPLGQIDFRDPAQGAVSPLATAVQRALAANPLARPTIEALGAELRREADAARAFAEAAAARRPYRDPAGVPAPPPASPARSPAEAAARRADASSMSAILSLLLVVGGLFVFSGAVWLVAVSWEALGQIGRFGLLALVTAGIMVGAGAAERRGYARSGAALMILGAELLWADGAYVLDLTNHLDGAGAWSALALAMTAVAFLLGWMRRSAIFGGLAAAHFAVFAACFGAFIKTDTKTGPATYSLAVAVAYAGIALVGEKGRGKPLGMPFAVGACLMAWVSALVGLVLLGDDATLAFGAAWPYGILAIAAGLALATREAYRALAWTACAVLAVAPTIEALVQHDVFAFLGVAIAIGFALVVTAFRVPAVRREASRQTIVVLLGILNAIVATSLLFLLNCLSADGLPTLFGAHGRHLVALIVVSGLLVGSSYAFGDAAVKKDAYRLVELAGLAQFFGAFTLASAIRYDDWFYPAACLVAGAVVLAVGVATRRATLAVLASGALLANLSIQYFAKLRDTFPVSVLVIGFGMALLACGVLYERRVRHLLPRLRAWD
jgi:hypothetical protein